MIMNKTFPLLTFCSRVQTMIKNIVQRLLSAIAERSASLPRNVLLSLFFLPITNLCF